MDKWHIWDIDSFELLKFPEVTLHYGPFRCSTRDLARWYWHAQFRENVYTGSCRLKFYMPDDTSGRMLLTYTWKNKLFGSTPFKNLTRLDMWQSFHTYLSIAHMHVSSNVTVKTPQQVVKLVGEEILLKAMFELSKERIGDFTVKPIPPPKVNYIPNWWEEDQRLKD